MHRAYRPQLVFWVPFGLLFAVVKSIGAIDWASSTKHMTAAVTQTVRMAVWSNTLLVDDASLQQPVRVSFNLALMTSGCTREGRRGHAMLS